uniref:Uncharacterized protein n=1 Tax=Serinus canaria TaxID=9135 RepID=A0A8C9L4U1_SERCA
MAGGQSWEGLGRKSSRAKEKKQRRLEERAAMAAVCAKVEAANKVSVAPGLGRAGPWSWAGHGHSPGRALDVAVCPAWSHPPWTGPLS